MITKQQVALFAAASAFAVGAQAQVYKCVDAGGNTVYAQVPCPGGSKSRVIAKEQAQAPAAAAASAKAADPKAAAKAAATPADREMEFRKRQQEKEAADKKAAEVASVNQRNCSQAREQFANYDAGGRIARVNAQGERYFLDDQQVAQEKAKAQAAVAQFCN